MRYEEAWEKSKGWIKHYYYNVYSANTIEYDDYEQECALRFVILSKKFAPFHLFCITKLLYKYTLQKMFRYLETHCNKTTLIYDFDKEVYNKQLDYDTLDFEWSIQLDNTEKKAIEMYLHNFTFNEICKNLNMKKYQLEQIFYQIKLKYIKCFNIKDIDCNHIHLFNNEHKQVKLKSKSLISEERRLQLIEWSKPRMKSVIALDEQGNIVMKFESQKQAIREFGLGHDFGIYDALKKRVKRKGYYWKYAE